MKYLIRYDVHKGFLASGGAKDAGKEEPGWIEVEKKLIAGGLGSSESGAGYVGTGFVVGEFSWRRGADNRGLCTLL
jgi:hypothetical protein